MWRCAAVPKWVAGLGVASSTLALGSGTPAFVFPGIALLGIGVPVGMVLLLVCIAALGVVMLREAKRAPALA
jgi:hypothetical protein